MTHSDRVSVERKSPRLRHPGNFDASPRGKIIRDPAPFVIAKTAATAVVPDFGRSRSRISLLREVTQQKFRDAADVEELNDRRRSASVRVDGTLKHYSLDLGGLGGLLRRSKASECSFDGGTIERVIEQSAV